MIGGRRLPLLATGTCVGLVALAISLTSSWAPIADAVGLTPVPPTTPLAPAAPTRELATGAVPTSRARADKMPPEYRLAILEKQGLIPEGTPAIKPNDPLVRSFAQQLDAMAAKCVEDRDSLADQVVATNNKLAKRGVQASKLAILAEVNAQVPAGRAATRCGDSFDARSRR